MNEIFTRGMAHATRLTQQGKLGEATALIQSLLRSTAPRSDAHEPDSDHSEFIEIDGIPAATSSSDFGTEHGTSLPTYPSISGAGQFKAKRLFDKAAFNRNRADATEVLEPEAAGKFLAGTFANAAGERAYKLYVPTSSDAGLRPLIVMLHGCTQSADDFANGTRMNHCAQAHGCFVVYPEQKTAANASKCWNWFKDADQFRGRGEPSIIADLTIDLLKTYPIDPKRVYIAGLSAGGAAAAVLGECYPDIYAAVGVHSGLACGVARDMPSALIAMAGQGKSNFRQKSSSDRALVPTISFHGDSDRTVHPRNGVEVIARAAGSATFQTTKDSGERNGRSFSRLVYRDGAGNVLMEEWIITGAGHAWSGGSLNGSFTDCKGPDASREMLRFFLLQSLPGTNCQ